MDDDEALTDGNFDAAAYVRHKRAELGVSDERRALAKLRATVHGAAESSAAAVRTNVFHNYYLFIETAKQISYLEGEMYELNHLLGEQRRLLENLHESVLLDTPTLKQDTRAGASSAKKGQQHGKSVLQSLMERVDGLAATGTSRDDWSVLFEGDWTELDMDSFSEMGSLHVWLLSDSLLLAKPSYDSSFRDNVTRYRLDSLLALENVALASVPTREDSRHVLKLLAFPQQRLFACKDAQLKASWLQGLESAKRSLIQAGSFQRQRTIRSKSSVAYMGNVEQHKDRRSVPGNPFDNDDVHQRDGAGNVRLDDANDDLEWLIELPDEIDVCIAQRDFDTALELLFDGRENVLSVCDEAAAAEIAERLSQRETNLVTLLSNELRGSTLVDANAASGKAKAAAAALGAGSSGGPKAVRKAATLLVKLGKASLAADLYLKRRTAAMRRASRRLRLAEDPLSYLRQLSRIVFGALLEVTHEFASLFATDEGCCAVLLLWASGEVRTFSTLVLRHVIEPGTSLALLSHCVRLIFNHCKQLSDSGIDLTFEVESLLLPALQKSVATNSQSLVDAAKLRIREEKWRPYNLQAEAHLYRFIEEMIDFGLFLDVYVLDDPPADSMDRPAERSLTDSAMSPSRGQATPRCRLCVSEATCTFARTLAPLARDLYLVSAPSSSAKLKAMCQTTICDLWLVQLRMMSDWVHELPHAAGERAEHNGAADGHADNSAAEHEAEADGAAAVLARSAEFLLNCVLPKCRDAFPNAEWMEDPPLDEISDANVKANYPQLAPFFGRPTAALQKYESIGDV